MALGQELSLGQPGGQLYMQSASVMLAQHLLRHYSHVSEKKRDENPGLPAYQVKLVTDYLRSHLADDISLATLAGLVKLSGFNQSGRLGAMKCNPTLTLWGCRLLGSTLFHPTDRFLPRAQRIDMIAPQSAMSANARVANIDSPIGSLSRFPR